MHRNRPVSGRVGRLILGNDVTPASNQSLPHGHWQRTHRDDWPTLECFSSSAPPPPYQPIQLHLHPYRAWGPRMYLGNRSRGTGQLCKADLSHASPAGSRYRRYHVSGTIPLYREDFPRGMRQMPHDGRRQVFVSCAAKMLTGPRCRPFTVRKCDG
jgi:hypothetical protein